MSDNTFNDLTSAGRIEIAGEQVKEDATWKKLAAPYVISGVASVYRDRETASVLTIEPGVTVKFNTGAALQIGTNAYKGILIADATPTNPITFTSNQATPASGNWKGITLSGEGSSSSILSNVIIEYGGTGSSYNQSNLTITSSVPTIRGITSRYSAGSGIYFYGAANQPKVFDSTIHSNKWGIYSVYSNPGISNSRIYGNSTAGAWNVANSAEVIAPNNWWGTAAGPYHASNPSGTGNSVSDNVVFSPWLVQAPETGLVFDSVRVAPSAFNPEGDELAISAALSCPADWTISITDSGNTVVRTFTGSGARISLKWYGDNNASEKVADGDYTYLIEAVNPATTESAAPLLGRVKVLRQLPVAVMAAPVDEQMITAGTVLNVTGTAADSVDFKKYTLHYGLGDNPSSWVFLKSSTTSVQNALLYNWNLSGLSEGQYTLKLTVTDNAGNVAEKTARIRLLRIISASLSKSHLSPNGDGIKDSTVINATSSYQVNWTVNIINTSGTTVRSLTGVGDSFTQAWDGMNSEGATVPDGTYTCTVNASDPLSSVPATPWTSTLTVDTTPPVASIVSPVSGSVLRNIIPVTGTASDINLDNFALEYGPDSGSGPWSLIATGNTEVNSGTLASWTTNDLGKNSTFPNGSYLIRLTTTDKAGNISTATVPVRIDNLLLSDITASSHSLDTNAGQTATVSFTINMPATVTFKIVPEKLGSTGTPAYQTTLNCATAGPYSFAWNGRNTAGTVVPDEAYLYILEASDGTRTDGYTPTAPVGSGGLYCKGGIYNLYKNLPFTVSYSATQPARVDISILWGAQNFKIVDAVPHLAGSYTYCWDGSNPANKMMSTGATASCAISSLLPENHIITTGNTPKVTQMKVDPYQVSLSYGQNINIKYTLSRQAKTIIKLVSPSGVTSILSNNLEQVAGNYELVWTFADLTDSNGKKFLSAEEGDYMILIQALNPTTGSSSVARGYLNVGN